MELPSAIPNCNSHRPALGSVTSCGLGVDAIGPTRRGLVRCCGQQRGTPTPAGQMTSDTPTAFPPTASVTQCHDQPLDFFRVSSVLRRDRIGGRSAGNVSGKPTVIHARASPGVLHPPPPAGAATWDHAAAGVTHGAGRDRPRYSAGVLCCGRSPVCGCEPGRRPDPVQAPGRWVLLEAATGLMHGEPTGTDTVFDQSVGTNSHNPTPGCEQVWGRK